jgi:hypothetical protein
MAIELLPQFVRDNYEVHEQNHACAILQADFPQEWQDIGEILSTFRFYRDWITCNGGNKSPVTRAIDSAFYKRGWGEKEFAVNIQVDGQLKLAPTHKVDCHRNGVALEVEWNNKDPFFDRDLNAFRLLYDARAIGVGVIITRCDHLQGIFEQVDRGASFGTSTTHMSKLLPRIYGGSGGGCPLLVLGITEQLYVDGFAPAA